MTFYCNFEEVAFNAWERSLLYRTWGVGQGICTRDGTRPAGWSTGRQQGRGGPWRQPDRPDNYPDRMSGCQDAIHSSFGHTSFTPPPTPHPPSCHVRVAHGGNAPHWRTYSCVWAVDLSTWVEMREPIPPTPSPSLSPSLPTRHTHNPSIRNGDASSPPPI